MSKNISSATKHNWERLGVQNYNDRLKSRANKSNSTKTFIPTEYLTDKMNIDIITDLVNYIKSEKIETKKVIHSLGINLLFRNKIDKYNEYAKKIIDKNIENTDNLLMNVTLPKNEHDILGLVYQSLQIEGDKNSKGSYYTPKNITNELIEQYNISENDIILDPACGSGSFLLSLSDKLSPDNLVGFDNDKLATEIARYNLLLKHPKKNFVPQIFTLDFIKDDLPTELNKIDYIMTNPPWGARIEKSNFTFLKTKESFSLFLAKSLKIVKNKGNVSFLLPKSFLKVRKHKNIRKFILENFQIKSIYFYDNIFEGVVTDCLALNIKVEKNTEDDIKFYLKDKKVISTPPKFFGITNSFNILPYTNIDQKLLKKAFEKPFFTLKDSTWALGIVTGNNKEKLSESSKENWEKIYTGKEIKKYNLKEPRNYILYDRNNLQQVAPDKIYRANEKLVYKYISNKLVFAYDNSKSLFLNSANIIIPNIPNMSIKTVLAFLNSNYMKFLYIKLFDEVRTLKSNLMALPFPEITEKQNNLITKLVTEIIQDEKSKDKKSKDEKLQKLIYSIMNLSEEEIYYIENNT